MGLDLILTFAKEEKPVNRFLKWKQARALEPLEELCVVEGGKAKYAQVSLTDGLSGEEAGRVIYTLGPRTKEMEEQGDPYIMEEYIVLNGGDEVTLRLDREFGPYRDWNNNFMAETGSGHGLAVEVANRLIFGEDLEGKSVKARLSVFPRSFNVKGGREVKEEEASPFDGIMELLSAPEGGSGFTMPMVCSDTFFFTTFSAAVTDCHPVTIEEGGPLRFYIVTLSTGFGTMPMAVDKETFEEKHLAPGTALVVDGTIVAEMLELSAQNE